jgi:hypothetical protein
MHRLAGPTVVFAQDQEPMLNETIQIIQGTKIESGTCKFSFGGGGNIGDSSPPLTYHITAVDKQTCQAELHIGVRQVRPVVDGPGYDEDSEEQYFPNATCADVPLEEQVREQEPCEDSSDGARRPMEAFAPANPNAAAPKMRHSHYNQQLTVNATTEDPPSLVTSSVRVRIKTRTSGSTILGVYCASNGTWLSESGWARDAAWSDISDCPLYDGTAIKFRSEHYYNNYFCALLTTHAYYLDISAQLTLTTWNFWATDIWTDGSCTSLLDQYVTPYPGEWW